MREQLGVGAEAHFAGLDQADALDAAGDDDVHAVDDDLLGGGRDGHQPRGALAVDRHAGDGHRKARAKRGGAADGGLHALLQRGAHDDVVDLGRIDLRALDRGPDRVCGERRRRRRVERAAIGLADAGAGGGNDHGVAAFKFSSNEHQAEPQGGQRGLVLALDLDRHGVAHQRSARALSPRPSQA